MFQLTKAPENPILTPRPNIPWEKDAVLNSSVVKADGLIHLFYRAVAHNPGDLNRSSIGHAWSKDGIVFERQTEPILASNSRPEEAKGVEDPRVVKLGDTYYMTYSAWDEHICQVALATSRDLVSWQRHGILFPYKILGRHNKNACLWPEKINGRFALLHRPMSSGLFRDEPDNPFSIWISFSDDLHSWDDHRIVMEARPGCWDSRKIGIAGPPIRVEQGWLLVYHGVSSNFTYRLGIALLDANDPTIVLKRQDEPILEPEEIWERKGDVPNVVFSCGSLLMGHELWVYYGGADTVIGLARGDVREFLREIPSLPVRQRP